MSLAFLIIAILALIVLIIIGLSLLRIKDVLDVQRLYQRDIAHNIGYVEEHFRKGHVLDYERRPTGLARV